LTEPSSNSILKRNTKQQKSIFFKKSLYFCTHFKQSRISGEKPPTVLPLIADQIQFPPGGGASKVFPPSFLLPATINQSASLTSTCGRREDEGSRHLFDSPRSILGTAGVGMDRATDAACQNSEL